MARRLEFGLLLAILILYAMLAYGYATRTPDWQIPDEPAHYNYVRQIVETGDLPVIEMGDWDQPYLDLIRRCAFHPATIGDSSDRQNQPYLDACGFDPAIAGDLGRLQYEDHQPPLYYLLQSAIYRLSDGDLTSMRLFSALLGSGAILCAYAIVRRLFPLQSWFALVAAAFIAFLPQRLSIMAGVSNDSLAELIAGLVLLTVTYYLTSPTPDPSSNDTPQTVSFYARLSYPLLMGILVGLAFLTKATIYYVAGIAGLAILLRWWREGWNWQFALKQIALFAVPALLIGMIWWIHGIQTYGGVDVLGLQRHDEVVVGQPRTDDYINIELGGSQRLYWENLGKTTFHSFWGQFGWMALPMQPRIYRVLQLALLLLLIGLAIYARQTRWLQSLPRPQREILGLFLFALVGVFLQFLLYNRAFVQFQGRYLYPALIPMALFLALGMAGWLNLVNRWQLASKWLLLALTVAFMVVMVAFGWYALREIIVLLPEWN